MKILHIGDEHIKGLLFNKCKEGFRQITEIAKKEQIGLFVSSGDLFDKPSVADKYRSLGDLQRLCLDFLKGIKEFCPDIIIIEGNHEMAGHKQSALEFLKDEFTVVQKPDVLDFRDDEGNLLFKIGCLPWISKSTFYANKCVGKSKSESNKMFSDSIHDMLGYFKTEFGKTKVPSLLFGHAEIAGYVINKGFMFTPGSFTFNSGLLNATGANHLSLSHIHKRGELYVGAPWQTSFGEEGNPQGFELITVKNGKVAEEYIELDLPKYITKEIRNDEDLKNIGWNNIDSFKLRFYSEASFNKCDPEIILGSVVEQLWNVQEYVTRTERELNAEMGFQELLDEYIKINGLPEGVTDKEIKEAVA